MIYVWFVILIHTVEKPCFDGEKLLPTQCDTTIERRLYMGGSFDRNIAIFKVDSLRETGQFDRVELDSTDYKW